MEKITFTTTFKALRAQGACAKGYKKLAKSLGGVTKYGDETPINLLSILASNGVDDCLWSFRAVDHPDRDWIARYIACDCAETVLNIFEKEYPKSDHLRNTIAVARRFADGEASQEELDAAVDAAVDTARAAAVDAAWAAQAVIIQQYLI